MTILVTGATGFVGAPLCRHLIHQGHTVRAAVRGAALTPHVHERCVVGDIAAQTDWTSALQGVGSVVHLAARVHRLHEQNADFLSEYQKINVDATLNLARQAAQAGVRRFVFLSSVKVNGEMTIPGRPFSEVDQPHPIDAYGRSKLHAELGLQEISRRLGMQTVIVRPPLVYGAGVKANFASLMNMVVRGIPLPLGAVVHNRRSFVGLDNLVDLLSLVLRHPDAADRIFMVADGEDLSTAELLQRMAIALGVKSRLIHVPVQLLQISAAVLGQQPKAQRLLGNLQVDIGATKEILGWSPPFTVDEELSRLRSR